MNLDLNSDNRLNMDIDIDIGKTQDLPNTLDNDANIEHQTTELKSSIDNSNNNNSNTINNASNANIDDALINNDSNQQNLNTLPDTNNDDFVDALDTIMHNSIENNNKNSIGDNNADNINNTISDDVNNTEETLKKEAGFWNGMKFYINQDKQAYDHINDINQLINLIKDNDGILLKKWPAGKTIQDGIIVSPYNYTGHTTVSPTYIKACTQVNRLIDYHNYLVPWDNTKDDENNTSMTNNENQNINRNRTKNRNNHNDDNSSDDSFHAVHEPPLDLNDIGNDNSNSSNNNKNDPSDMNILLDDSNKTKAKDKQSNVKNNNSSPNNSDNASKHKSDNDPLNKSQSEEKKIYTKKYSNHNTGKTAFNEDEDAFILDVVRKNPTRRNTHSLYDEISNYIPNHTGNSIRHRYRVYLSKNLDFVYKVDNMGKLLRDELGNLIKTKELPPILKKKFTAVEDYSLAMQIKKQFYKDLFKIDPITGQSTLLTHLQLDGNDNLNISQQTRKSLELLNGLTSRGSEPKFDDYKVVDRRGPVAREFFKEMAELYPDHSENAWRDRFRKFLLPYGIDNYIEYYEMEIANDRVPEPMKNLTNRKRNGPAPGNNNITTKRLKAVVAAQAAEAAVVQSNTSESNKSASSPTTNENNSSDNSNKTSHTVANTNDENSNIENMEASTSHHIDNISKGELINTESISKKTKEKEAKNKTSSNNKELFDTNEELLDEETYRFISSLKKNFENNENLDTDWILSTGYFNNHNQTAQDASNVKQNIDNSDHNSNNNMNENENNHSTDFTMDNNANDIDATGNDKLEYSHELADAVRYDYNQEKDEGYDDMNFDTIMWPPSIASAELFSPRFYEMNTPREFIEKITEIVNREFEPSQAEKLVQILWEELGVRKTFSTAILTSLSGDLMVLPRYFLTMFKKNENPPRNVPGIWTREDDDKLRGGDPNDIEELKLKHGINRIQMRAKFISNNII